MLDLAAGMDRNDYALMCMLATSGLRVGEVCALNIEDLGRKQGQATIKVRREKGNPAAEIPLAPRTAYAIEKLVGRRTEGPLFTKRHGERADRKSVNRVVQRVAKAAGVSRHLTPHSFRHAFITIALNSGVSMRDLQNSMGYSSPRMLTLYDREKDNIARHATHTVSAQIESS